MREARFLGRVAGLVLLGWCCSACGDDADGNQGNDARPDGGMLNSGATEDAIDQDVPEGTDAAGRRDGEGTETDPGMGQPSVDEPRDEPIDAAEEQPAAGTDSSEPGGDGAQPRADTGRDVEGTNTPVELPVGDEPAPPDGGTEPPEPSSPPEDDTPPDSGSPNPPVVPVVPIEWSPTGDNLGFTPIEAATLSVPLNYDEPEGEWIELALARVSTPSNNRTGTLLYNPGGPGVGTVADAGAWFEHLAAIFPTMDLVLMDNRGVGLSAPLSCVLLEELEELEPDLPEETTSLEEAFAGAELMTELVEACEASFPGRVNAVTVENVARDMEQVRLGLDEELIHYWGVSYGTLQGSVYAALYPDHVGVWVLDSPVIRHAPGEPNMVEIRVAGSQSYETQLNRFFEWCDGLEGCTLNLADGGTAGAYDLLTAELEAGVSYQGQALPPSLLQDIASTSLLIGDWELLAVTMIYAAAGDWEVAVLITDSSSFGAQNQDTLNSTWANLIINRLDFGCPEDFTPQDAATIADETEARFPRMGSGDALPLGMCAGNQLIPDTRPTIPSFLSAPPILVLGGLYDPATPHEDAISLVQQFDNGSHLLTTTFEGHGNAVQSPCVLAALDEYVITGNVSDLPARCEANALSPQSQDARVSHGRALSEMVQMRRLGR